MQYRFISVLAVGALVAVGSGAPIAQAPTTGDTDTIDTPSNPTTVVTWGKREAEAKEKDIFTIGPIDSTTTWGSKRSAEAKDKDIFTIGPIDSTTTWGSKREAEAKDKDIFKLGPIKSTTTWGSKRDDGQEDTIEVPTKPTTEVTWS